MNAEIPKIKNYPNDFAKQKICLIENIKNK